jgi:hypothetical protein
MIGIGITPDVENGDMSIVEEIRQRTGSHAASLGDLIEEGHIIYPGDYSAINIGGLSRGTSEGKPVVWILVDVPNGKPVLAQTTLSLFLTAADTLKAKWGDPR